VIDPYLNEYQDRRKYMSYVTPAADGRIKYINPMNGHGSFRLKPDYSGFIALQYPEIIKNRKTDRQIFL